MASSEDCGFTFTWIVENIGTVARGDELESSKFVANCLWKTEWHLVYTFKQNNEKCEKIADSVLLCANEQFLFNKISIDFELSIFDVNNEKLESFKSYAVWFHRGKSIRQFLLKSNKNDFSKIKTIRWCAWPCGTKFSDSEQAFCHTHICIERRFFKWTVENVNQLGENTSLMTMDSKNYPCKSINLILNTSRVSESKLQVEFAINTTCDKRNCDIGICSFYPYIQDCQISIVDKKGNKMEFFDQEKWRTAEKKLYQKIPKSEYHDKYYFHFPLNSINKDPTETCFPDGLVSFQCECEICFGVVLNELEDVRNIHKEFNDDTEKSCSSCKTAASTGTPAIYFMKDVQQLYTEKDFCDFNLKTETEIYPVHRAILSVRSPVFKAIFSHDMKESASQSVDIPDLSADTVRRMLLYMYTDKVGDIMWKDAFDLYIAGDKYQLLDLKERCSSILKSNLRPSNACEILILADERYDEDLKRAAQDYIVEHDLAIIHIDAWKDIEKNNPHLGIDILRRIVIKRQNV